MNIAKMNQIPCNVEVLNDAYSIVSFTIPTDCIRSFVLMFESLSSLMKNVQWKIKTDDKLIHSRNEKKQQAIDDRVNEYNSRTIETFKTYLNQGVDAREAFSLTVSAMGKQYAFSSYDNIKNVLTKNKLLKNTGFYKSRHKFD